MQFIEAAGSRPQPFFLELRAQLERVKSVLEYAVGWTVLGPGASGPATRVAGGHAYHGKPGCVRRGIVVGVRARGTRAYNILEAVRKRVAIRVGRRVRIAQE